MKRTEQLLTLIALSALCAPSLYAGLIDFNLQAQVQTCVNVQGGCKQKGAVSGVGEVRMIDITSYQGKITDLGMITTERKDMDLAMPQQKDGLTLFSFKAQNAAIKKTIYVAFRNESEGPGKKESGKAIIYMYRQIEGDPKDKWVEVAQFKTAKGVAAPKTWPFNLLPDGTWVTINPQTKVLQKLHLGTEKVTVSEEKAAAAA